MPLHGGGVSVQVRGLVVEYAAQGRTVRAVDGVSFTVERGAFYTLLGPSGCGKTSTLRCIAGLESARAGEIRLGDQVVVSHAPPVLVPPHKRDIGMVFQSYAIWPHLNVFENVAFPLRLTGKLSDPQIGQRVESALAMVQLDGYGGRLATQLSGGQQQRLALARALVREPSLLLLDEPLSNLDAKLRESMRIELREIQKRFGITTIYVTHDQGEALAMSDRIAVMEQGRIVQEGSPREIYSAPASPFVAGFVGSTNFIRGTVQGMDGAFVQVRSGLLMLAGISRQALANNTPVTLSVRPENIAIHRRKPEGRIATEGVIEAASYLGEYMDYRIRIDGQAIMARHRADGDIAPESRVFVEIDPRLCTVLPDAALPDAVAAGRLA